MFYWVLANYDKILCPNCSRQLGTSEDNFPQPVIAENGARGEHVNEVIVENVEIKKYITKTPKSSKYLIVEQLFSSSPAGRLAVSGEYIVVKRRWKIPQPLIAEYLRFWRVKRNIPIKKIDQLLGYKGTAGHIQEANLK